VRKLKVMPIFGTRPEAIKMAPVIMALRADPRFETVVCATSQHRHMQDQALSVFGITPEYDLNLMKPGQSLNDVVSGVLIRIGAVLEREQPDWVLVQGDTSTAFAAALAAFHARIAVGHVEAGLRSYQKFAPYPEEINRKMVSALADLHFAPTAFAREALVKEGVGARHVVVTGNTVIDALFWVLNHAWLEPVATLVDVPADTPLILVTGHRRENFGDGFQNICEALKQIANAHPDYQIVYPVHLNPNVQQPVLSLLGDIPNIRLLEPLGYVPFVNLMKRARFIISDSGGIQEEATALGKPVLVMRDVTERPEGVQSGVCQLVGTDVARIVGAAERLIRDPGVYRQAAAAREVFGDGMAAEKILAALLGA